MRAVARPGHVPGKGVCGAQPAWPDAVKNKQACSEGASAFNPAVQAVHHLRRTVAGRDGARQLVHGQIHIPETCGQQRQRPLQHTCLATVLETCRGLQEHLRTVVPGACPAAALAHLEAVGSQVQVGQSRRLVQGGDALREPRTSLQHAPASAGARWWQQRGSAEGRTPGARQSRKDLAAGPD